MLGEAGALVYCTGRSARGGPPSPGPHAARPETIEETAALVDAAGGTGIPVRVDHGDESAVATLAERVRHERGTLDILVNVLGGPEVQERFQPMWTLGVEEGKRLFDAWLTPHVVTVRHLVPLMIHRSRERPGLVVEVVEGETLGYAGHFYWDLVVTSLKRLAFGLAEELVPHRVAALAVAPGFMRTEAILAHFGATDDSWREIAESSP
ncbi:MAG TPA: SDR family NAD(P)-dependent oxidoreductase, partial [Gemmatimonadaceae bacterium]|nr:SDR family NAD(P)-dependent oxidoreductase [Gemmatimonadaceae bacterium]